MEEVVFRIAPHAEGWWVYCDLPLEPTYFSTSPAAEAAAKALALKIAALGHDVRVLINDQADTTVVTQRYFAAEAP